MGQKSYVAGTHTIVAPPDYDGTRAPGQPRPHLVFGPLPLRADLPGARPVADAAVQLSQVGRTGVQIAGENEKVGTAPVGEGDERFEVMEVAVEVLALERVGGVCRGQAARPAERKETDGGHHNGERPIRRATVRREGWLHVRRVSVGIRRSVEILTQERRRVLWMCSLRFKQISGQERASRGPAAQLSGSACKWRLRKQISRGGPATTTSTWKCHEL